MADVAAHLRVSTRWGINPILLRMLNRKDEVTQSYQTSNQVLIVPESPSFDTKMTDVSRTQKPDLMFDLPPEDSDEENLHAENEEFKRYKKEVNEKLVREFDLEKTISQYKELASEEYDMDPADFSLHSAMPASRVRDQIMSLTGSHVIKLSDFKYRAMLIERIKKEDEEQMDKQEEERAEMERQRLRRLMAEGIIKPEDLKEDSVLFKDADRSSKPARSSSKRRKKKVEVKEWSSLKPSFTPPPKIPVNEAGNRGSRPGTRGGSGVSRQGSRSPSESQTGRLQQNGTELETPRNGEIEYDEGRERSRPHTAPESRGSPGATRKRIRSAAPRVAPKYKDPLVEQMKQEQTISGLYSIAEKLVITKIDTNHKSTKKTAHFAE